MKTGAWLRGGRGKIAGMVAQKSSDGKGTVLRELVVPKNPQTVDQMATRLAFGTVTQAASLLLPIIGQTFKGQSDDILNRRRFVALNTPMLKQKAISQAADETNQIDGFFRAKNSSALIPNAYIISEGSLVLPVKVQPKLNAAGSEIECAAFGTFALEVGQSYKPSDILAKMFGIRPEQQLTIVCIGTMNGVDVDTIETNSGDFVRNTYFVAARVVLNTEAAPFVYTAQTTVEQIEGYLATGFDAEKTAEDISSQFIHTLGFADNTIESGENLISCLVNIVGDNSKIVAAASIISEQMEDNSWNYSTSTMVLRLPKNEMAVSNNNWYGLGFRNSLVDYLGVAAASKLFTRKGGTRNVLL